MMARRSNVKDVITNGRLLSSNVDMRSSSGRRFSHLVRSYTAELGGEPSESQLQADVIGGLRVVESDEIIRLSSEHRRLVTGLQGHAEQNKPAAGPSVEDLFAVDAYEAGAE